MRRKLGQDLTSVKGLTRRFQPTPAKNAGAAEPGSFAPPAAVLDGHYSLQHMPTLIPYFGIDNIRAMTFVDGENLAIRFGSYLAAKGLRVIPEAKYRPGVYLWWNELSGRQVVQGGVVIRTYYYTAVQGDEPTIERVATELKQAGVEAPRVFKKTKSKGSEARRHFFGNRHVDSCISSSLLISQFWWQATWTTCFLFRLSKLRGVGFTSGLYRMG